MWQCIECSEQHDDTFDLCWNCGLSKDGTRVDPQQVREAESQVRQPEKPAIKACPRCNAHQVMPAVRVTDEDGQYGSGDLSVRIDRNPDALFFKDPEKVELVADVCGNCGFTELYVTNPGRLWSAFNEQRNR